MTDKTFTWTDNPTVSGVSKCDTDVLNDCLMHLKYNHRNKGGGYNLFDTKICDHILTGEEALGWVIQGGLVTMTYPDAVNLIKEEYTNGVEYTEGEVTYKLSPTGRKIADISQYEAIDKMFVTKGFAPFYVLDSANQQFYLPKNKSFIQFTDDTSMLNKTVDAGLPNIEGKFGADDRMVTVIEGSFYHVGNGYGTGSQGSEVGWVLGFDASKSNAIYGKSETVQPPAVLQLLYYKVGDAVINSEAASIDAQRIYDETRELIETKTQAAIDTIHAGTAPSLISVEKLADTSEDGEVVALQLNSLKQINITKNASISLPDASAENGYLKQCYLDCNIKNGVSLALPENVKLHNKDDFNLLNDVTLMTYLADVDHDTITFNGTANQSVIPVTPIDTNLLAGKTFEYTISFTPTAETLSSVQDIVHGGFTDFKGICFEYKTDRKIGLYLSTNGTSWNLSNNTLSTVTFPVNQKHHIRLCFDGSSYKFEHKADGVWVQDAAIDSTDTLYVENIRFGAVYNGLSNLYTGKIHFDECSFVVDGVDLFKCTPGVYKNRLIFSTTDGGATYDLAISNKGELNE